MNDRIDNILRLCIKAVIAFYGSKAQYVTVYLLSVINLLLWLSYSQKKMWKHLDQSWKFPFLLFTKLVSVSKQFYWRFVSWRECAHPSKILNGYCFKIQMYFQWKHVLSTNGFYYFKIKTVKFCDELLFILKFFWRHLFLFPIVGNVNSKKIKTHYLHIMYII